MTPKIYYTDFQCFRYILIIIFNIYFCISIFNLFLLIETIKKNKAMNKLIDLLKKETETLKVQYLEMTEKWAVTEFENLRQFAKDYQDGKLVYKGEVEKRYYRLPYYIVNSNGKVEQHIEKMVKNAIEHYDFSIEKLAARIEKKGLNVETLKTSTSHIGVNIETTLTDGEKTVRAFTIIAEGAVQRPHYRYLIK
jgi:hypothetical protein